MTLQSRDAERLLFPRNQARTRQGLACASTRLPLQDAGWTANAKRPRKFRSNTT